MLIVFLRPFEMLYTSRVALFESTFAPDHVQVQVVERGPDLIDEVLMLPNLLFSFLKNLIDFLEFVTPVLNPPEISLCFVNFI
jgi:hypothetical protein